MKSIFKYELPINGISKVIMPEGAKILKISQQGIGVYIWALIDTEAFHHEYRFRIIGTGHPIEEEESSLEFVETFMMNGGQLVFHVFKMR